MSLNQLRVVVIILPFIFTFTVMGCNRPFDPVSPFPEESAASTPTTIPTTEVNATATSAPALPTATATP